MRNLSASLLIVMLMAFAAAGQQAHTLKGKATTADGQAVSGARVRLYELASDEGGISARQAAETTSATAAACRNMGQTSLRCSPVSVVSDTNRHRRPL